MNRPIFYLLIVLLFNCSKTDDDTDNNCTEDCTIFRGEFISLNGEGVRGVRASLDYKMSTGTYSNSIRKIVETSTDKDGVFNKAFYIQDNELGDSRGGYFRISFDDSALNVNKYILSNNQIGTTTILLRYAIYSINSRDTVIGNTYYLPRKTFVKVNLVNFVPEIEGDKFEVRGYYPFGPNVGYNEFLDSEYSTGFTGFGTYVSSSPNTEFNVYLAANEKNVLKIRRTKNGISTIEEVSVRPSLDNSINLTFEY